MIKVSDIADLFTNAKTICAHCLNLEVKPPDISYNEKGLCLFGNEIIEHKKPRLAFAKALNLFDEDRGGFYRRMSEFSNCVTINGQFTNGAFCSIGFSGFGYELDEEGTPIYIKHFGSVIINNNVILESHVCIMRGVLSDTIIGENTKIDNYVHVAHGAVIGKNCLIAAGAVIGGSAVIGDNCFIGINASIKNKVRIGNNVTVGMGAVVIDDVPDGVTVVGNPAKIITKKPD